MKNSFVLYTDYLEQMELLSMEQRGTLLTALMSYAAGLELPDMDSTARMAFMFIKKQIERDSDKYQETIERRKEAGKKGGLAKAENRRSDSSKSSNAKSATNKASKSKQAVANVADNVYVNDNVNENVTDTDIILTDNNNCTHDMLFTKFWNAYPKKENIVDAEREFAALGADDFLLGKLLQSIADYQASGKWDVWKYIPSPANWLRKKRYLEDPIPPPDKVQKDDWRSKGPQIADLVGEVPHEEL